MLSSLSAKNGLVLPRVHGWSGTRPKLAAAMRALYKRCVSAFLTSAVLFVGFGLIALSCGMRLPSFSKPSSAAAAAIKPKIVSNTTTAKTCSAQIQANPLFANCPSFWVNYAGQTQGTANSSVFNVASGAPVSNSEAEYYTSNLSNLRVENGSLLLEAQNQSEHGYKYTSARIDTHGKEDFLYGKLVIRAIMPDGIGTWPAIWMMPSQPKYASLSPASDTDRYLNDGEMDIAESAGVEAHTVYGVAHSIAYPEGGPDNSYYNTVTVPDNNTVFHDYELDWTPTSLTFSVDGKPFYTYAKQAGATWRSWPFDQPFYLIIDLALGGTWAGNDRAQFPTDGIDKAALPAAMQVQSINYYSYVGAN